MGDGGNSSEGCRSDTVLYIPPPRQQQAYASPYSTPPLPLLSVSLSLFFPFFCFRSLHTYTATTTIQPAIIGVWVADKSGGVAAELARAVVSGSLGWEKLTAAKQPAHSTTKVTRGSFFRFFLLDESRACRESFW